LESILSSSCRRKIIKILASDGSTNMMELIVFRGIQGIGGGILIALPFIVVGEIFSPRERSKYMGILASVFGISSVAGPILGGLITDTIGWRWIFFVNVPVGIVAVTMLLYSLPNFKLDDVKIIGQWNLFGNSLAVPAESQFKTFQDLLEYAKKNPGLTFGNPGVSATPTIRMENLNAAANLKMVGVPFKGDTEVVAAVLGKHVPVGAVSTFSAKIQAEGGKLRILFSFEPPAVYGLDPKTPYLASVFDKSIVEKDIETVGFVFVPGKTPDKIVKTIADALEKACKDPEVVDGIGKLGAVPAFIESGAATAKLRTIMERVKAVHEQTASQAK